MSKCIYTCASLRSAAGGPPCIVRSFNDNHPEPIVLNFFLYFGLKLYFLFFIYRYISYCTLFLFSFYLFLLLYLLLFVTMIVAHSHVALLSFRLVSFHLLFFCLLVSVHGHARLRALFPVIANNIKQSPRRSPHHHHQ